MARAEDSNNRQQILHAPLTRAALALMLIVIVGCVFSADGTFYKWNTHRDMLRQASEFGILACGMTLVIITAGIDLSVGSVLGLVAVAFSIFSIHWGWPAVPALGAALAVGAACGIVSGSLTAHFGLQPFIATLAMMVFARGLGKWLSGGQKITTYIQVDNDFKALDLPAIFSRIDSKILGGNISVVTVIFLACVVICWILLNHTRMGRYLYAIGGNEEAARLSGVPVARVKLLAYGLCGFFAAVAGICHAAQEQQGDPEAGSTYELTAIAIVVVGGTNLMGGKGGILLTLLGTLTIGYVEKILSLNALGEPVRLMTFGAIIVAAVLVQGRKK